MRVAGIWRSSNSLLTNFPREPSKARWARPWTAWTAWMAWMAWTGRPWNTDVSAFQAQIVIEEEMDGGVNPEMEGASPGGQDESGLSPEGHHQIQMEGEEQQQMMNEEEYKDAQEEEMYM
jgi:hypothetical protein